MSFVTATRAAAALPNETNDSSAGSSHHQGRDKKTLSQLVDSLRMSILPSWIWVYAYLSSHFSEDRPYVELCAIKKESKQHFKH